MLAGQCVPAVEWLLGLRGACLLRGCWQRAVCLGGVDLGVDLGVKLGVY